jgi:hypothetical protein
VLTTQEVLNLVNATETPRIRAGATHRLIDTWVVVVQGRLFCRQWSFKERSWYHAFIESPAGAITCGGTQIEVRGLVPDDLDAINPAVNKAYLAKYEQCDPPGTALEMTGPRHMARTMELVPVALDV